MIPLFRPSVGEEEIAAVAEVLSSGWIGLGPKTAEFEQYFANYLGVSYAVGVSSGTDALHLALAALGVGPGDEVIVPTITFVSTAHAVRYVGATPVFADVQYETLCIDTHDVARKITPRTKAIIPVHYGGHPCDLETLMALADEHGIYLVEDAAHACGASFRGSKIGALSTAATCFSFHAVKNLTCGEGGMITTHDPAMKKLLHQLRWCGIDRDTWDRTETEHEKNYAWQYGIHQVGFKAHLSDIAAAIGLVQLTKLERLNARRREIVEAYNTAFGLLEEIETPPEAVDVTSSWHIYHIKLQERDNLIAFLKKWDITPGVHYYPIHLHPVYRELNALCPVAEEVWKKILSLPLFPDLTDQQVQRVIGAVDDFCTNFVWRTSRVEDSHCVLRHVEYDDLPILRAWRNHPESHQWFFSQEDITPEQQKAWWEQYLKDETVRLFVIETPEGEPIGTISLTLADPSDGVGELGHMLVASEHRGRGYGRLATNMLLQYAFDELGLQRVFLEVMEENQLAINLYQRCGLVIEKMLRGTYAIDGELRNKAVMVILKEEWERRRITK